MAATTTCARRKRGEGRAGVEREGVRLNARSRLSPTRSGIAAQQVHRADFVATVTAGSRDESDRFLAREHVVDRATQAVQRRPNLGDEVLHALVGRRLEFVDLPRDVRPVALEVLDVRVERRFAI